MTESEAARQAAPLLARLLARVDPGLVSAADTSGAPPSVPGVVSAALTAPGPAGTRPPTGPGATPHTGP